MGGRKAGGLSRLHSFKADSKSGSHTPPTVLPLLPHLDWALLTLARDPPKLFHVYPDFPLPMVS